MELTKGQIQFIENRLENDGIKYWDIRIEMLDHVVTDVQNRIENGEKFKNAVQNSFVSLGWKENFNGSSFEGVLQEKQNLFAKKYSKKFWSYFKTSVFKPSSLIWIFSLITILYFICSYKVFLKYALFTFLGIVAIFFFYFLTKYRVYKSVQLNNALTQSSLSLSILNVFIFLPKTFDIDVFKFPILVTLVFSFVFILSYLGIRFFLKEYTKINNTYQKLISL